MKKRLFIFLMSVFLSVCLLSSIALAATVSEKQDGLSVTLTTDKEEYADTDEITAVLSVINENEESVSDVVLTNVVPAGYELSSKTESLVNETDSLAAGETVSLTAVYTPVEKDADDEEETSAPDSEEETETEESEEETKTEESTEETETEPESENDTEETETEPETENGTDESESEPETESGTDESESEPESESSKEETETEPESESGTDESESEPESESGTGESESEPETENSTDENESEPESESGTEENESEPESESGTEGTETEPETGGSTTESENGGNAADDESEEDSTDAATGDGSGSASSDAAAENESGGSSSDINAGTDSGTSSDSEDESDTSEDASDAESDSSSSPDTGDTNYVLIWAILFCASIAGIIVLLIREKKWIKRILSFFLCVTLLFGTISLSSGEASAAQEQKQIEISVDVQAGDNDVTVSAFVTYSENDDEDVYTVTFADDDGSVIYSVEAAAGETVSEPAVPEKEGYVFVGWYTDTDYEELFLFDSTAVTEDITLYAGWADEDDCALIVEYVAAALSIEYASGDRSGYVTKDLTLPTEDEEYKYVEISWSTSSDTVTSEGVVTRPDDEDEEVTLTAAISYGSAAASVSFAVTVIHTGSISTEDLADYSVSEVYEMNSEDENFDVVYDEDYSQVISITGTYSDIVIGNAEDAQAALQTVHTLLGIEDAYDELEYSSGSSDEYSSEYHFVQEYSGYQVYGRTVTVSADSEGITDYLNSGLLATETFAGASCDITLSAGEAEAVVQAEYGDDCEIDPDDTAIVWYSLGDYEESPVLVYNINVYGITADEDGEESSVDDQVFVSVSDGTIVSTSTNISDAAEATGSGETELGETVTFPVTLSWTGSFYMQDLSRGITVSDGSVSWVFGLTTKIKGQNSDFTDTTAVSAYTNVITVYDWYLTTLGRDSIDGEGMDVEVIVHGSGDEDQAAWNPKKLTLTFYDNSSKQTATKYTTAACLDVAAHEYTHGVLQFASGAYSGGYNISAGLPGAINEGYADIFACLIDGNWTFEETRYITRRIDDPGTGPKYDAAIYNPLAYSNGSAQYLPYPDSVESKGYIDPTQFSEWNEDNDYGGKHRNSTIVSHAAYLMSDDNDPDNCLTDDELALLWYKSMSKGYDGDSDFWTVRRNVLIAAYEMLSAGELDATDIDIIKAAFDEVGITVTEDEEITISGTVIDDSTGEPISGAAVTISHSGSTYAELTTGEDGSFTIILTPKAAYKFTVTADGYDEKSLWRWITSSSDTITIKLSKTVLASGTCGENATWELTEDGTLTISGTGEMYGYLVSTIYTHNPPWYDYRTQIVSVVIEDGITGIGLRDFVGLENLTSVEIPDSVITIGSRAFRECSSLTGIEIPDSVTTIGSGAFSYCTSLESIKIPDGVTTIEDDTFTDCESLTDIDIPESVTGIGDSAFWYCINLVSIEIPDSVTTIGNYAFAACSGLTGIEIPDSVITIGDGAFNNCTSLTVIDIPDSVTTIGGSAFSYCTNLTDVNIGSGVSDLSVSAFAGCTSLENFKVSENNTAFSSIDGVLLNADGTELILYPMGRSGSYTIPDSVTTIGNYAFAACSGLTGIEIPDSVITIGDGAFNNCTSLTDVTFGESVTTIGAHAFMFCTSLKSITIPDSVTSLEIEAFRDCTALESAVLGEGITTISNSTFYNCTSLCSVTVSKNVTSIGDSAFRYCSSLTDVYYSGSEEDWAAISITDHYNDCLLSATIHYNCTD